jgi:hypothetical protein
MPTFQVLPDGKIGVDVRGSIIAFETLDDHSIGLTKDRVRRDLGIEPDQLADALELIRRPNRNSRHGLAEARTHMFDETEQKVYKLLLKMFDDPSSLKTIRDNITAKAVPSRDGMADALDGKFKPPQVGGASNMGSQNAGGPLIGGPPMGGPSMGGPLPPPTGGPRKWLGSEAIDVAAKAIAPRESSKPFQIPQLYDGLPSGTVRDHPVSAPWELPPPGGRSNMYRSEPPRMDQRTDPYRTEPPRMDTRMDQRPGPSQASRPEVASWAKPRDAPFPTQAAAEPRSAVVSDLMSKYGGGPSYPSMGGPPPPPMGGGPTYPPVGGPPPMGGQTRPGGFDYLSGFGKTPTSYSGGPVEFSSLFPSSVGGDSKYVQREFMRGLESYGTGRPAGAAVSADYPAESEGHVAEMLGFAQLQMKRERMIGDIKELCDLLRQPPPAHLETLRPAQLQPIYDRLKEKMEVEGGAQSGTSLIVVGGSTLARVCDGAKDLPVVGKGVNLTGLGEKLSTMSQRPFWKYHMRNFVRESGFSMNSGITILSMVATELITTFLGNSGPGGQPAPTESVHGGLVKESKKIQDNSLL